MSLATVTIAGTINNPDGTAATGTISFTLLGKIEDDAGNIIALPKRIKATVINGALSQALYASDAGANVIPYQIQEVFGGSNRCWIQNFLIADGPTIDYAPLGPLTDPPSVSDNYITESGLTTALAAALASIDGGSL